MNLTRALSVEVPAGSKLETEGEAANINSYLEGVLLQKEEMLHLEKNVVSRKEIILR